jgi:hypothetical protein
MFFADHQKRLNVTFSTDGKVAEFTSFQYYTALNDRTLELEQQYVTSLDMPLLGTLFTEGGAFAIENLVSPEVKAFYQNASALFINRTAYDVIWGWQNDTLLTALGEHIGTPTTYPGIQVRDRQPAPIGKGAAALYAGSFCCFYAVYTAG